jgi:ubiquinone/menaquinone biosynthesis C-methylase UbiE
VAADDGGITERHRRLEALRADTRYLREEAYRVPDRLERRIALHRRFSANATGWLPWVFDRLELPPGARVLDAGCGNGDLWRVNLQRLDPTTRLTLADLSEGMLDAACAALGSRALYVEADLQSLPFADGAFDVVLANHVLYHVPDLPRALDEVARVLAPGGRFYATTVGERHLAELRDLVGDRAPWSRNHERFGLGNGAARLAPWFGQVELHEYPDTFLVTETEPVIDYLLSTTTARSLTARDVAEIRAAIDDGIARDGVFVLAKHVGLFAARAREEAAARGEG